jgi:hypothetical protein
MTELLPVIVNHSTNTPNSHLPNVVPALIAAAASAPRTGILPGHSGSVQFVLHDKRKCGPARRRGVGYPPKARLRVVVVVVVVVVAAGGVVGGIGE